MSNISAAIAPAGTAVLSLESGGSISQAAAGTITETNLAIIAGGNAVLDTASNSVANLAAQVSGGASNFSFKNAGALNIANSIDGVSGILTPGMTALISGGALTQSAGALLGGTSAYIEGSKVILPNANPVGVIAGKTTGAATGDVFNYASSNAIMVTTGGILTASTPDAVSVVLNAGSAGISQSAPIIAGAGTNGLSLTTTGPVSLNAANSVSALTAVGIGQLGFVNLGALTVGVAGAGVTTTNGPISISAGADLTVKDPVSAGTNTINLSGSNLYLGSAAATTVTGGAVSLTATSNSGTVSQFTGGTVSAANGLNITADKISFGGTMLGGTASGDVGIQPFSAGRLIEIAGASATLGTLSITATDLAAINPTGSGIVAGGWRVGNASSGAITFKGNFSDPGGMFTNLYGASVSQDPVTVISGSLDTQVSGAVTLANPANQINVFTTMTASPASVNVATNVPTLTLFDSVNAGAGGLNMSNTLGNILVNSVTTASTINLQSANGITLGATSSLTASGAGNAIVLNAGPGSFVNNSSAAAAALSNTGGGRWLVYAASPASVNKGGLTSAFRQYNTVYGGAISSPTGNGFIYASTPGVLSVDTTLVSGAASNTYGTAPTAVFGYALAGIFDKEDILGAAIFTPAISSTTPAGGYTVSYSSGLTSPVGYTFTPGVGLPYTVDPATLTLITINASLTGTTSKVYDGNTNATLVPDNFLLSGFVNSDSAIVTQTAGTYADPNVGSGILVSTTLAPSDFSPVGSTNLSNYTLPTSASGFIGSINPALLSAVNAVITGSVTKVYDGTTSASLAPGNFLLSGFVNGDSVTVTKTTGTYASRNAGSGILVSTTLAPSDFSPLGTTSLSNYTLPTSASGNVGTITVRPLSTWSGLGGNSLWSNPANWDALPDGNNVLAVSIPASGNVTFDGSVALQSLTSAGSMTLNGNNLSIGSFSQTGGSLAGTGNLNVSNSFNQTGGTISLTGAAIASITQATGNLNIASLSAPAANLTARTGAITQTGPIIVAALDTLSATGTALNDTGNRMSSFSASNGGSGNIALTNTGILNIAGINNSGGDILVDNTGAVTTTGAVSASGSVSIAAHSPLTIGNTISAGGNITLTAGAAGSTAAEDIITINGAISGSSITLAANSVTGTIPAGAALQVFTPATPTMLNNLLNDIIVIPSGVPFNPPTPPALMQTPAANPPADASTNDGKNSTTTDEKKKDAPATKQEVVTLAAEPAPAAAPMPVCR